MTITHVRCDTAIASEHLKAVKTRQQAICASGDVAVMKLDADRAAELEKALLALLGKGLNHGCASRYRGLTDDR